MLPAVQCEVLVDGKEIGSHYPAVTRIVADLRRDGAGVCELQLRTLRGRDGRWSVHDDPLFAPWRRVTVIACFGHRREEVMRGAIRDLVSRFPPDMGEASVTVIVQDDSLLLDREHRQQTLSTGQQPQSDADLVRRLVEAPGLSVDAGQGLRNRTLHLDATPAQLLFERAQANGYELLFRRGTVYFGPPRTGAQPQPAIQVYAGSDSACLSLEVRHKGRCPDGVRLSGPGPQADQATIEVFRPTLPPMGSRTADSRERGLPEFIWNLQLPPGSTEAERRARAQAQAERSAWKLVADGELDGARYGHVLRTHEPVQVDGIGPTYSGLWYVDAVRHEFSHDGYRQSFRLLRNAVGEQFGSARVDPLAGVRT